MKSKILIIGILALFCTGCYEEIDLKPSVPKRLCIYAEAHAGENVKVNVIGTHIWGDESPCVLDSLDTEVQLRVNDEFVENLKMSHVYTYSSTYELQYLQYVSKYIPKEGDRISITATNKQYGEVQGETTVPKAVKISSIECNVKSFSPLKRSENDSLVYCDLDVWFDVEFEDPVGVSNFYSLSGRMQGYMPQFANFDIEDPIFKEYLNPLDVLYAENMGTNLFGVSPKFKHFSDHSFDGKRKKFTLNWTTSAYAFYLDGRKSQRASFNLNSETKESFDVILSLWNYIYSYKKDLSELGLGGYIWLASNVSTSGGYVVSSSKDIKYVDIDSVVRKYYEEHYLK